MAIEASWHGRRQTANHSPVRFGPIGGETYVMYRAELPAVSGRSGRLRELARLLGYSSLGRNHSTSLPNRALVHRLNCGQGTE